MQLLWLELSFNGEIMSLSYLGLDIVDFEHLFKAWITKYSLKYGYMY